MGEKKSEAPHVLEFLGESLDSLNIRDDIVSSNDISSNDVSSNDERLKTENENENEFYNFLSTGRYESTKNEIDEIEEELSSAEEEKEFYDFLSTGKYRQKDKNDFFEKDENEIIFNDVEDIESKEKHRFKRSAKRTEKRRSKRSSKQGNVETESDVSRIDDYFAARDSLFGGSNWDGHYLGDIWFDHFSFCSTFHCIRN